MQVLGIKLFEKNESVTRNLKEGWYPFCDINEPQIGDTYEKKYSNLYFLENNKINISINCIVGENGSGKSSLLDLYYRIINNLSFYISKALNEDDTTLYKSKFDYSENFAAKLYFEANNKVGVININGGEKIAETDDDYNDYLAYFDWKGEYHKLILGELNRNDNSINFLSSLFYSIITNYSLYSFNQSEDYEEWNEDNSYLYQIFNKNDGYVAPIVLCPYRSETGTIDPIKESKLEKQRLFSLLMYLSKQEKELDKNDMCLIEGYSPIYVTYKLDVDQKLNRKLIYFLQSFYKKIKGLKDTYKIRKKDKPVIQEIQETISTYWENSYKTEFDRIKNQNEEFKNNFLIYLTYKSLKIICTYNYLFDYINIDNLKSTIEDVLKKLVTNKSHFSLKLKQCLFFLNNLDLFITPDNNLEEGKIEVSSYLSDNKKRIDDYTIQLPPPLFSIDLIIQNDEKEEMQWSELSSGERQLLSCFSYFIYHLKNLESIDENDSKYPNTKFIHPKYQSAVLIFDEAELYLHPNWQRKFIYKLISCIEKAHFSTIKEIQVIIATHSPFLLCDIPSYNILALQDGERKSTDIIRKETFCSNFYDLLQSKFFMDYSIGEFSRKKLETIINAAESPNKKEKKKAIKTINENLKSYKDFVDLVADPYFKDTLHYMLYEQVLKC